MTHPLCSFLQSFLVILKHSLLRYHHIASDIRFETNDNMLSVILNLKPHIGVLYITKWLNINHTRIPQTSYIHRIPWYTLSMSVVIFVVPSFTRVSKYFTIRRLSSRGRALIIVGNVLQKACFTDS